MSQSYPWFKFAHVEYLLDPMITSLSLAAQGANTRLMAYAARQLPFGTLPNDDKTLLAMSGAKTPKQWQKLYQELMGTVWFCDDDGRLYCPLMVVESVPVVEQEAQEDKPKKALTNAERQAAYKARQAELALLKEKSNETGNEKVTGSNVASNAQVTDGNETGNGNSLLLGGKGGDLDLDLDLKQELNSHSKTREAEKNSRGFFDDELRPDLNLLNAKLGANLVTQKFIDENLFSFNSHYETHQLTDNQRLAKWITWFRGEQAKIEIQQAKSIQQPRTPTPKKQVFGNFNDSFPIDPNDRLLTQAEREAIARELEEDENVVF